jgi:energy-coupling factor transporter ATP-binding protein EcfA2
MAGAAPDTHLLRQLQLPARYEALVQRVGAEVAQLLVEPGGRTQETLAAASVTARARGEGLFLPLVATSGTGKTTLANNLAAFLPNDYGVTVVHTGEVAHGELVSAASKTLPPPNDPRLIPINIDHREATPPTPGELAEIKRFLREETVGARCAIVWPQTSREQAEAMARAYIEVAGPPPVDLPVEVEGPPRATWRDTAINTLRLSNEMIDSLELIGVDPRNYDPEGFTTIGDFLRQISDDFAAYLYDLLAERRTPLRLIVVFAS